jgi:hypothetical protein
MEARQCDVWAIHKKFVGRMKDWFRYSHAKHVCVRVRNFAQEHEGDHKCSCGFTYAKGPTDND